MVVLLIYIVPDLAEETGGLLGDFDQDISTVAISMDKVVLHQHLKESSCAETSYHRIERMYVLLEVSHWHSFHKTFHKNRVSGLLLEGYREIHVFIIDEMFVERDKVVFLNIEVYLINQCLLKRFFSNRNLIRFREER